MTDRNGPDPRAAEDLDPAGESRYDDGPADPSMQEIFDELLNIEETLRKNPPPSASGRPFDIFARDEPDDMGDPLPDAPAPTGEYNVNWTPEDVAQATGTASKALGEELIQQTTAARTVPRGTSKDELGRALQANLAMLKGIAPRDVTEGMLAAQMVGAHNAAMACLHQSVRPGESPEARDGHSKHAVKFMTLYTQQMAALDKHRGKGQQKITVEHVTVEAGGQAIVGTVTAAAAAKPAPAEPAQSLSDERPAKALAGAPLASARAPGKAPAARKRRR